MQSSTWSRVFRNIWRINGVAMLLLLALAIVGISSSLISSLVRSSPTHEVQSPNVAPPEEGKPKLRLGRFEQIGSTSIVRAELRSSESDSFTIKSSGGGNGTTHNVLFVDTNDGKSWWLLPDSNSIIEGEQTLAIPGSGTDSPLAKVFHFTDPINKSSSSLVLADLKGIKKISLVTGAIELDQVITLSATEAKVVFHDAKGFHVTSVNPTETTKLRDAPISFVFPPRK